MRLSIVIPVLNEGRALPALLAGLKASFPRAELIVVDGGSADDSLARAREQAHLVLRTAPGRARQMNRGAAAARGEWLFFLHADSRPDFGAAQLAAQLPETLAWGFFRLRLIGRSRALGTISRLINCRSAWTRIATGDQGLIIHAQLFRRCGGFAEIPLMEDVEFTRRLRAEGKPLAPDLYVESSARRWDEQGVAATVLRMWALRAAYALGVSPRRLWAHYYGRHALRRDRAGEARLARCADRPTERGDITLKEHQRRG